MSDIYYKLDLEKSTLSMTWGRVGRWYKIITDKPIKDGYNGDVAIELSKLAIEREVREGRFEPRGRTRIKVMSPFTLEPLEIKVTMSGRDIHVEAYGAQIMVIPKGYSVMGVHASGPGIYQDLRVYISKTPLCGVGDVLIPDVRLYDTTKGIDLESPLRMRTVVLEELEKREIVPKRKLTATVIDGGHYKEYQLSLETGATEVPFVVVDNYQESGAVATITTIPYPEGWHIEVPKGPLNIDVSGQIVETHGNVLSSETIAWALSAQETLKRYHPWELDGIEFQFDKSMSGHKLTKIGLHPPKGCSTKEVVLSYVNNISGHLVEIIVSNEPIGDIHRLLKVPADEGVLEEMARAVRGYYRFFTADTLSPASKAMVTTALHQIGQVDKIFLPDQSTKLTFTDKVLAERVSGKIERLSLEESMVANSRQAINYSQMHDDKITQRLEALLFSGLGDKTSYIVCGRDWLAFDHAESPMDKLMVGMLIAHLGSPARLSALFTIAAMDHRPEMLKKAVRVMNAGIQSNNDIHFILDFFGLDWVDMDVSVQLKK